MSRIVCYCKNVTEEEIKNAIADGAKTLKDIQKATGACMGNNCAERNPAGECCSFYINMLLKSNNDFGRSCCCG